VRSRPGPPISMTYVYILRSERTGKFYIGCAGNPLARLAEHQRGQTISTRGRGPWLLVYQESLTGFHLTATGTLKAIPNSTAFLTTPVRARWLSAPMERRFSLPKKSLATSTGLPSTRMARWDRLDRHFRDQRRRNAD
ncbi:MAG: GIY-YIG nuclease family protein, partial [Candidatus Sulfotelmatobacter sp.]